MNVTNRFKHSFSLAGVITIAHLSLWAGLFLANSALCDAGGVIVVDDSNRVAVTALKWFGWLIASPFYLLVAPRGFDVVLLDVAGIVANSLLIGFGLAGGIRLVARRKFGLRFLFAIMTLSAICLYGMTFHNDTRILLFLFAATLTLLLLSATSLTDRKKKP